MTESEKILNNFNSYGGFVSTNFFVQTYNKIPSVLNINFPLKVKQENLNMIIEKIDLASKELSLVFKQWKTSKNKNAIAEDDFPYYQFYCSQATSLCLTFELANEEILMEFLYDQADTATEEWVLQLVRNLRNTIGKPQSPVFEVLAKGHGNFYTEEINIDNFELDVEKNYNDDFVEVHQIVNDALQEDKSGLILLHGAPGTGKTSYIKSLLSTHQDTSFIFIPNDFVNELLQPDFITFLIAHKNAVLVIEDAEKVLISREDENRNSVVSTILQLTDGLFSDYLNIKAICTFNTSIQKIDKALLRKGRMIAFYEFKALSYDKTNQLLTSLGQKPADKELTLAEIFNYQDKSFNASKGNNVIGFNTN